MNISRHAQAIINAAYTESRMRHHEYLTPEHILFAALNFSEVQGVLSASGANIAALKTGLDMFFREKMPEVQNREPIQTVGFQNVIERAVFQSKASQKQYLDVADILVSLYDEEQNFSSYFLRKSGIERIKLLQTLSHGYEGEDEQSQSFFRADRVHIMEGSGGEAEEEGGQKKGGKRSALDRYAMELTALAKEGRLEPVIGREEELERTIQVLCRRIKNNPIHVGDSGVGKTAITEGIAQRIAAGRVPPALKDFSVYSLDMGALVAGTRFRGDFEERVKKVVEEVQKKANAILFVDEIHTLVGAGAASGSMDASNLLKPALASGSFRCIGSTTHDEYKKYFDKDHALSRRFQKIDIEEPSEDDTVKILNGLKPKYEDYHHVRYTDAAINAAVRLSAQYIAERKLPDKAIDVLDEAGAFARISAWREGRDADGAGATESSSGGAASPGGPSEAAAPPESFFAGLIRGKRRGRAGANDALWEKIRAAEAALLGEGAEGEGCAACGGEDALDGPGGARARHRPARKRGGNARAAETETAQEVEAVEIDVPQIETVVARIAKIPERSVGESERDKLRYMEDKLKERVFGQDAAVSAVARAVKRSRAGFRAPQKPVANFLFAGPTGVGKTELAKSLAELLGLPMHRFDMSEYQEKHTISRLIGSPPGYVGYEEGGLLTDAVRKQPHCVLLLDEIEKAHADIYNILLQIMDYATLTDNNGRKADFRNAVLIMTSNAGARDIGKSLIGFGERLVGQESAVDDAVEKIFTPEFRNRLDAVVKFDHLSRDIMLSIVDKELEGFAAQLAEKGVTARISDACRERLAEESYSREFGARDVGRVIEEKIKSYFVDEVLFGKLAAGGTAHIDWSDERYRFTLA